MNISITLNSLMLCLLFMAENFIKLLDANGSNFQILLMIILIMDVSFDNLYLFHQFLNRTILLTKHCINFGTILSPK